MADFELAYSATNVHEGEIADHPSDPGGFTYRGIASTLLPGSAWEGWKYVSSLDRRWTADQAVIDRLHREFFRRYFWRYDPLESQALANEVYDAGVLCGVERAGRWLQRALNGLNRRASTWPDLQIDGVAGPKTLAAANTAARIPGELRRLGYLLEAQRGVYHLDRALECEPMEDFLNGHIERVLDEDFT